MDADVKIRDQIKMAIGPVTSNWGLKSWRLLFVDAAVIAWPYTWLEAFRIGAVDYGFSYPTAIPNFEARAHQSARTKGAVRRHRHRDVIKVVLRSNMNRNAIEFTDQDRTWSYGIWHRHRTDEYSGVLQGVYGGAFS
ncbi:MAG: hypothetical protein AAGM22_16860 [Acidobacteriota bacterium]